MARRTRRSFRGNPCDRCGGTERYACTRACVACSLLKCKRYYRDHEAESSARGRRWREAHPEEYDAYHRQYRQDHRRERQDAERFRLYGLRPGEFDEILEAQGGGCAVCKAKSPGGKGTWCVDHEHVDGYRQLSPEGKRRRVRGLLCHPCNVALHRGVTLKTLRRALKYLWQNSPGL